MEGTTRPQKDRMTTQERRAGVLGWPAGRQLHDKAYFLDLLGRSNRPGPS